MKEGSPGGVKTAAQFAMSFALVCLSLSIAYFTYEMARLGRYVPDVLTQVDQTTENINPIVDEVAEIRKLVPEILAQVEETRKLIPPILEEVEQTRKQIPPILREVEQIRKQIPPVLNEVEAVRKELPAAINSVNNASAAVVTASREIEATRPLIQDAITEVKTTRESIPPMMDRADELIDKAHIAGKQASEGAVTGVLTGIFTAPFTMVGDVLGMNKEEARRFSKKDIKMFNLAVNELLNVGAVGDKREWNNPESGINGRVKILRFYVGEGDDEFEYADCSEVMIKAFKEDEILFDHQKSYCKDDNGKWNLIDND